MSKSTATGRFTSILSQLGRASLLGAMGAAAACSGGAAVDDPVGDVSMPSISPDARYFVTFADQGAGKAAIAAAGGHIKRDLPQIGAAAAHIPEQALFGLAHSPAIELIEVDAKRYPSGEDLVQPDGEIRPFGLQSVQAEMVSDGNAGNRTICIIDSGLDAQHEEFAAAVTNGTITGSDDLDGAGPWDINRDPYGGGTHGTHVAGTIAALNNGVGVEGVLPNRNVKLHIVRVFGGPDDTWAYSSDLVAAAYECQAHGADVISMSLGCSSPYNRGPYSCYVKAEDAAFADLNAQGILSIAAAGNDGNTLDSYPASYDSVVSVAAVDANDVVASFSQQTAQVELAGPGVHVLSSVPMGTGRIATTAVTGGDADGDGVTDVEDITSGGIEGSPVASATGALVDCMKGTTTCPTGGHDPGKFICLIERGDISFADKVLACQNAGGAGAIIYNNEPGLIGATLGGVETSIPSVDIGQADGQALVASKLGFETSITVSVSDYAYFNGTSMATPHVSAVAALVWSYDPTLTNEEVRAALRASALDLGPAGRDDAYGWGLVQAYRALSELGLTSPECGDGSCNGDETCDSCETDCGACPTCGDGSCNGDETCDSCEADCGSCPPPACGSNKAPCSTGDDCCSGVCKGGSCRGN